MNIVITRIDGAMMTQPAPPYLIDYLQYSHRSFQMINYRRVNKFETKFMHHISEDGSLITLPGFFEKITQLIHQHHDTYTVTDNRTPMPEVNWEKVKDIGLRDYQMEDVVKFLFQAKDNSGIVNATGGYGKTIMQMVTYAAFSELNTILAVPLAAVFNQTYNKFCTYFPDKKIGKVGDGFRDVSNNLTIATFKSLKNCSLEKCELLLLDEIQSTTGDTICSVLKEMRPRRVFGFTATDKNLFNNADKLIKGLFGERLIHVTYEDAEEVNAVVPGLVYFVDMPETASRPIASSLEGKISQGIKNHPVRNKLIGEICSMVPENWQTLIFVDHIADHLTKVYKELPEDSKFLHRSNSKGELGSFALTSKQQKEIIDDFTNNKFQYLVATDAFRAGVDVPNCRVVVQAAGGSSEVEVLQEAFRGSRTLPEDRREELGVTPKTHFVLIDIMDTHDDKLEGMSHKRLEIYRKQGWKIKRVKTPSEINWYDFVKQKKTLTV
jgi:superfamily II DNA or RNA helicase